MKYMNKNEFDKANMFGLGVPKNMAIGMAASMGKSLVHSAGTQTNGFGTRQYEVVTSD